MKCGIVGLPNAGKSTLFRALTSIKVPAENYPFCTIEPNRGVVQVPDPRVEKLSQIFQPEKTIYPFMEFVDIAGLIQGAHKGEGLGCKFLSHIRESQALLHVVRCFEDKNIGHVCSSIDPLRDIEIVESELLLSDLSVIQNRLDRIEKKSMTDKEIKKEALFLKRLYHVLNEGKRADDFVSQEKCSQIENSFLENLRLLTMKPCLYVCNVDESNRDYAQKVQDQKGKERTLFISCQMESELLQLSEKEQKEYLESLGLKEGALNRLIRQAYVLLNLITFFTAGPKEVHSWTAPAGTLAPKAGRLIHTDFEKGFIRAEVYSCEELFSLGSEKKLKEKGLYRLEGKTYLVQDGDVLFFRFNV